MAEILHQRNMILMHTSAVEFRDGIVMFYGVWVREMEEKHGFREMDTKSKSFFRSGSMGNWIHELTKEQVKSITNHHRLVMKIYNYQIP